MKKILLFAGFLLAGANVNAQKVSTISGGDEAGWSASPTAIANAKYDYPHTAVFDSKGNIWVSDENNNVIILLNNAANEYRMRSGGDGGYYDGNGYGIGAPGRHGSMAYPKGIAVGANDTLFIVDNGNSAIRRLAPFKAAGTQQELTTIAGGGPRTTDFGESGYLDAKGDDARFSYPTGIAISPDKTYLLVVDPGNLVIRKVSISGSDYGTVTTFAGVPGESGIKDGNADEATFSAIEGIYIDEVSGYAYVADRAGNIRKIANGKVSTVVKDLEGPTSVAVNGSTMYIADGCSIKEYDMNAKKLTLIAGHSLFNDTAACGFADNDNGLNAKFNEIGSISLSPDKTYLLVVDRMNNRLRKVTLKTGGSVGIEENMTALHNINVYPNPAKQYITIDAALKDAVVGLYDMAGRKITEKEVHFSQHNYQLNVADQKAGLYILKITSGGNTISKRVAIAK